MPLTKDGYLYSGYKEELPKELTECTLGKQLMQVKRIVETKLIKDFINFLNENYYPIFFNDDEVMEKQINRFLDERSKDNAG